MEIETLKRFDRLIAILIQLQSKKIVKASEMAERFEVSLRTIYRDLRSLQEAGVPLYGEAGLGYALVDGYRLPPVMFSKEEANAFIAAEKLVTRFTDKTIRKSFESALLKIKSVLREGEKNRIALLEDKIKIDEAVLFFNHSVPNALELIFDSLSSNMQLNLRYHSTTADAPENRRIEPVGVFHENQFWYIMAYCHLRNDYRQFRLDRIQAISSTNQPFTRSHCPLEEYRKSTGSRVKTGVKILVKKQIAPHLKYDRHFYGFVSEILREDSVEMNFLTTDIEHGFPRWYLMFADQATILEPEDLKIRVKELLTRITMNLEVESAKEEKRSIP